MAAEYGRLISGRTRTMASSPSKEVYGRPRTFKKLVYT